MNHLPVRNPSHCYHHRLSVPIQAVEYDNALNHHHQTGTMCDVVLMRKNSWSFPGSRASSRRRQRNGEKVACYLVKIILDFFAEVKLVGAIYYNDFEKAIVADDVAFELVLISLAELAWLANSSRSVQKLSILEVDNIQLLQLKVIC
ncbi:hypothetical protein Droror1_Dr00027365 [Drosera rotundifolia]